jgi:osmotically-inducible protein OsmY
MLKVPRLVKIMVCAVSLSAAFGCSSTRTHESAGEYVDDSVVTTRVKAAIFDEMSLKTFQINVKTYQGTVQLSGFVDSAQHAQQAADLARKVPGVKEVHNDLIVK